MTRERAATALDLVSEFEQGRVPGAFHHADHLRVAFAYVTEFPVLEAIAKFSAALQRFAISKGKPHLYHATITWAYLLLIHERIARAGGRQSWEEFAEHNPDLLVWKGGILGRYYTPASLDSDLARQTFLFPDVSVISESRTAFRYAEGPTQLSLRRRSEPAREPSSEIERPR